MTPCLNLIPINPRPLLSREQNIMVKSPNVTARLPGFAICFHYLLAVTFRYKAVHKRDSHLFFFGDMVGLAYGRIVLSSLKVGVIL